MVLHYGTMVLSWSCMMVPLYYHDYDGLMVLPWSSIMVKYYYHLLVGWYSTLELSWSCVVLYDGTMICYGSV
jgi:hypothetical protein